MISSSEIDRRFDEGEELSEYFDESRAKRKGRVSIEVDDQLDEDGMVGVTFIFSDEDATDMQDVISVQEMEQVVEAVMVHFLRKTEDGPLDTLTATLRTFDSGKWLTMCTDEIERRAAARILC